MRLVLDRDDDDDADDNAEVLNSGSSNCPSKSSTLSFVDPRTDDFNDGGTSCCCLVVDNAVEFDDDDAADIAVAVTATLPRFTKSHMDLFFIVLVVVSIEFVME